MIRPWVLVITDLEVGGAPRLVRDLALELRDLSPVVVSLAGVGPVGRELQAAGVAVYGLEARGPRDLGVLGRWIELMRELKPGLIQSFLLHANAVSAVCRPFVPPCPHLQSYHTMQREPAWHWPLQGVLASWSDAFLAPSQVVLDEVAKFGCFEQGYEVPNGIDWPRFAGASRWGDEALGPLAGKRLMGFVGRFDPVKRVDLLVEAFGQLVSQDPLRWASWELVLLGYGSHGERYGEAAHRLGIGSRVHRIGPVMAPERWYKSLELLCLPSEAEGFGLPVLEAIAAGVPVVVPEARVYRRMLGGREEGAVGYFSAGSVASLVSVLQDVSSEWAGRGGAAARLSSHLQHMYDLPGMGERYRKILEKFLPPRTSS